MTYEAERRAAEEHRAIGMRTPGAIDTWKVSASEVPEPFVPLSADGEVSDEDLVCAVADLSRKTGLSYHQIDSQIRAEATGRTVQERVIALAAVAERLLPGLPPDDGDDGGTLELSADLDDPAQEAARLASSGHGDAAAAKRLIKRWARELGVDAQDLPGFGDGVSATMGLTQESQAGLIASGGSDSVDSVIARYPELAHLFRGGR